MQQDHCLAGAGAALDNDAVVFIGGDDGVLVLLNALDDIRQPVLVMLLPNDVLKERIGDFSL